MFSLHVGFLILIHTDALGKVITIYHECEGRIENSLPRVDVWYYEACQVMTNGDQEGRVFPCYCASKI